MGLTRRRFLTQVAAAGSVSLAYEAMTGLGLLAAPAQARFELTGKAPGVRVVILGAGLAGRRFDSAREVATAIHARALTRG